MRRKISVFSFSLKMRASFDGLIQNTWQLPERLCRKGRTGEPLGILREFSEKTGLKKLRVHHETLLPGRKSSSVHSHTHQEECIYVLEGELFAILNGQRMLLRAGDFLAFPPGTGLMHVVLNDSSNPASFLSIASLDANDRVIYD